MTRRERRRLKKFRKRQAWRVLWRKAHPVAALAAPRTVHPSNFTYCPKCGVHILQELLQDHLDMACSKRGTAAYPVSTPPPWSGPSYEGHWRPW